MVTRALLEMTQYFQVINHLFRICPTFGNLVDFILMQILCNTVSMTSTRGTFIRRVILINNGVLQITLRENYNSILRNY